METIPDRFAARLEKVSSDQNDSIAQTARAYARDYLAKKIEQARCSVEHLGSPDL